MANVIAVSCASCGASLSLPNREGYATCSHCGSLLQIRKSEGAIYSELREAVDRIESDFADASSVAREASRAVARAEARRELDASKGVLGRLAAQREVLRRRSSTLDVVAATTILGGLVLLASFWPLGVIFVASGIAMVPLLRNSVGASLRAAEAAHAEALLSVNRLRDEARALQEDLSE